MNAAHPSANSAAALASPRRRAHASPLLPPPDGPVLDCLGVDVLQTTFVAMRDWFFEAAAQRERARSLFFVNAHTLNLAWGHAAFRSVLNRADLVLNDGIGLELYGKLAASEFTYNFNGTDLFPRLFEETRSHRPLRVFLLGAAPGRAELAARQVEQRFSHVSIVGARDGFAGLDGAVQAIARTSPDLLLVGMGNPRQEMWIDEQRQDLECGVAAGIGALLDFLSGAIPRAPERVRRLRLEWAYRLVLEPRRLSSRYLKGNPLFLARALGYLKVGSNAFSPTR